MLFRFSSNFVVYHIYMKKIISALLLSLVFFGATAQEVYNSSGRANGYRKKEQKGYDPDKLVIGGGLNLGYSGDYANLGISPKVGYRVKPFLTVGVGVGYQFYKAYDYTTAANQTVPQYLNIVYPGLWAKCTVYNPFFLSTDFEYDITKYSYFQPDYSTGILMKGRKVSQTVTAACWLLGAGFKQPLGGRTSATFEVMYDVIQADYSPYKQTLVYRAGIYVGL